MCCRYLEVSVLDDDRRSRLRRAGARFRAADIERDDALRELKRAVAEADGDSSPEEAADLTGLPKDVMALLLHEAQ